ncbi:MAG TPA: Rrf2 family transcriptional regulator [Phycisphaerae bacterium]
MLLSKRTQYGIRALVCFAESYEQGYLQSKEISAREKLPRRFLESILNTLTRGKYLTSRIGSAGGYRLAKPPEEIMLGEIVARLEGRWLTEEQPKAKGGAQSERAGEFAIRYIQGQLTDAVRQVLDRMSLADLAEHVAQQDKAGAMYFI